MTKNSGSIGVVAEDWMGGNEEVEDYNSVTNSDLSDSGRSSEGETSNGYSSEISSGSEAGIISSDEELVVENLPRSERYKLENIIVVGTLPGPKEPKNIYSYLKPLVDELLNLWNGVILRNASMFGITPIGCALTCITCDLPATRKLCGFKLFSSLHGCSKCFKEFPYD